MKLSKKTILDLYEGLSSVSNFGGAKFAYAVARNITKIEPEVVSLRKAFTPKDDFNAYNSSRIELAKSHAVLVDGNPKTEVRNGVEVFVVKDQDKFNEDLRKLRVEHAEAIALRAEQENDFNELLKEEVEIDPYMILMENLPDGITAQQLSSILVLVKEQ